MLINSYSFLYFFLPLVLAGYYILGRKVGLGAAMVWVLVTSLLFYAWGEPYFTFVLISSFTINFFLDQAIIGTKRHKKPLVIASIVFNLGVLGFFKYAYFFTDISIVATGSTFAFPC